MYCKTSRMVIWGLLLLAAFFSGDANSEYIEGIDTTDAYGRGLDSSFNASNNAVSGYRFFSYHFATGSSSAGYFNYAFDEIKIAPYIIKFVPDIICAPSIMGDIFNYCFIVQNIKKDSTFSKVQILKNLSGNRYIFKYGKNTTPNDRMLTSPDYDRSVKYKPNNLYNCTAVYPAGDSTTWEPPLPNDNHLLGYIFYLSKKEAVIDTSAPIDLAQWDSIAFFDTSSVVSFKCFSTRDPQNSYFNIVAVYAEGRSDFLKGWTRYLNGIVDIKHSSSSLNWLKNSIEIKRASGGLYISYKPLSANNDSYTFSIYTMDGRQMSRFPGITTNRIFWNTSQQNLAEGLYLVRVELAEGNVINKTLMYTR
jgi:hypothetical protein